MKPDWDKLMAEFADSKTVLVADVDCTAGGKDLCSTVGVQGYPTIKYGDPNNMEDYKGGRDFKALQTFAKENLGPTCGPKNLELCDAKAKAMVEKFMAMPADDLKKAVTEKEGELKKAEADFKKMVEGLQKQYEQGQKDKDAKQQEIKDSGLGLMKSVAAHRKSEKAEL